MQPQPASRAPAALLACDVVARTPAHPHAAYTHGFTSASPQGEGGAWRYLGGEHFLESLPEATGYADLMFSLSEKVDGAVSVKYQLPGEELDPELLISVNDDKDVKVGAAPCSPAGERGGRRDRGLWLAAGQDSPCA